MGVRFAILALAVLGYIIILLSNSGKVDFQFFTVSFEASVYYIIFLSTLFGVIMAFYFYWLMKSYKSLRNKVRSMKAKEESSSKSAREKTAAGHKL